jgi:hypothetical protein
MQRLPAPPLCRVRSPAHRQRRHQTHLPCLCEPHSEVRAAGHARHVADERLDRRQLQVCAWARARVRTCVCVCVACLCLRVCTGPVCCPDDVPCQWRATRRQPPHRRPPSAVPLRLMLPMPSCPCELRPHAHDSPSSVTTTVWWRPPHAAAQWRRETSQQGRHTSASTTRPLRSQSVGHNQTHGARTHARTHARTQARTHARSHTESGHARTSHNLLALQRRHHGGCVALQQVAVAQLAPLLVCVPWHGCGGVCARCVQMGGWRPRGGSAHRRTHARLQRSRAWRGRPHDRPRTSLRPHV